MRKTEKQKILNYLKKYKVIAGVPTVVKFKKSNNDWAKFKARRGYYVVRWDYILKALRKNTR